MLKGKFKDEDLSLHSSLSRIFSCRKNGYPEFIDSEMNILKYETIISKIIGIKRINFHMTHYELEEEDILRFKKMIKFAKKEGVELIYENHVCSARAILYIKEKFPELNMCLDIGHLNIAIKQDAFGMDLDEFIKKIKDKIIHIHAHNNDGEKDLHQGISNGIFDWKHVLPKLTNLEKIIFEVKDTEEVFESKKEVEKFYKN